MRAKLQYRKDRWVLPLALALQVAGVVLALVYQCTGPQWGALGTFELGCTLLVWRCGREVVLWRGLLEQEIGSNVHAALYGANKELLSVSKPSHYTPNNVGASKMLTDAMREAINDPDEDL